jgi:hypothetical protein
MSVDFVGVDDPRWRDALARSPHDFHHLPAFVGLSSRTTERGTPLAAIVTGGDRLMLLPIIRRDVPNAAGLLDATSPYGYPAPVFGGPADPGFVSDAVKELTEAMRRERYVSLFVRMHPVLDPDAAAFSVGTLITHGETVVIDLSLSDEEQWRQHQSGHRNEINKALRLGHEAFIDESWKHFDDFVSLYTETMKRLEASPYYFFDADYFRGMREALGPERLHLAVTRIGGEVAAASLITTVSGIVQYHLSGTTERFIKERPTKLLLHQVRRWATARGERWFHLGGGLGAAADSLFRFKAGFSKLRRTFRTWRVAIDADRYTELSRGKHPAGSHDLTGFFPAYRRP